jgi:hypothetical protein
MLGGLEMFDAGLKPSALFKYAGPGLLSATFTKTPLARTGDGCRGSR